MAPNRAIWGIFDADGYLFITGRLKEIINRGGEKISPRLVEQVLLEHPAVAQAVVFGIPHSVLGETIAAAVVLNQARTSISQFSKSATLWPDGWRASRCRSRSSLLIKSRLVPQESLVAKTWPRRWV